VTKATDQLQLKIGVVGNGYIGNTYAKILTQLGCNPLWISTSKTNIQTLMPCDVIIIAVPWEKQPYLIPEYSHLCKLCFVEKPLFYDDKSYQAILPFSDKIYCCFNRRFFNSVIHLKSLLEDQNVATSRMVLVNDNFIIQKYGSLNFWKDGFSSHAIDLYCYLDIDRIEYYYKLYHETFIEICLKDGTFIRLSPFEKLQVFQENHIYTIYENAKKHKPGYYSMIKDIVNGRLERFCTLSDYKYRYDLIQNILSLTDNGSQ
jgi:hypothetical protein